VDRHSLILGPCVTEKALTLQATQNQYCFVARPGTNRSEIKKAVEETLKVKVEKVRIINVAGKKKRFGRFQGQRPDVKKALVTVKKGEEIALFKA